MTTTDTTQDYSDVILDAIEVCLDGAPALEDATDIAFSERRSPFFGARQMYVTIDGARYVVTVASA